MRFFVNSFVAYQGEPTFILRKDGWNDWFKWYTTFNAYAVLRDKTLELGIVKIATRGMTNDGGNTELPSSFQALTDDFYSLGQDENYYETLLSLGEEVCSAYLVAMQDCAYSPGIFEKHLTEPAMQNSLLRDIDQSRVRERFSRLARGETALTRYSFEYRMPADIRSLSSPPVLSFAVVPDVLPATNIHVIIGRNGVGKTRCFDLMARSFLGMGAELQDQSVGQLANTVRWLASAFIGETDETDLGFAGLVAVSFSAFDSSGPLTGFKTGSKRYTHLGLVTRKPIGSVADDATLAALRVKDLSELADEFSSSVIVCREGVRRGRWHRALKMLESDPLFAENDISFLADDSQENVQEKARSTFLRLSSGHAVVLLSMTRLVEVIEEKTLVLFDEPESHLHPPLLAAFIRALSDLLLNRNAVAIIATHSPVVLQEIPKSCVWKLSRSGYEVRADRPETETFGENVGVLTREVFGLEVTQTGFYKLISALASTHDYDQIIRVFDSAIGAEGRALARALSLIEKDDASLDQEDN